ncbi:hypothetical protein N7539_001383 [Penicillium diatomitis]|uniref:Uncharacterized protein n=1 Tax=Penicillium diatomitis TaxID=2819901 RepID=A0A9X0BZK4_9EURO|nr:uncharacterized protein N7539_001383 [Penicillium diatomitis]KAJ5492637.1 hypothetical protein N7539_001383 [Penicillium diatomitis]
MVQPEELDQPKSRSMSGLLEPQGQAAGDWRCTWWFLAGGGVYLPDWGSSQSVIGEWDGQTHGTGSSSRPGKHQVSKH